MNKLSKLLALVLAAVMVLTVTSFASAEEDPLAFTPGLELRMATGYNNAKTGLFFNADIVGDGLTLPDGVTYYTGDLKPTWVEVEKRLGMKFVDKYQGNGASKEFAFWKDQLDQVDMISGTASLLSEYGEKGQIVNIADYLEYMPNFSAYLESNPIVMLSITGNVETGAIYFSPYFDGVNDIEKMPLMRIDMAEKLLNGEGAFTAEQSKTLQPYHYEPFMPTEGKITVDVVTADGTAVEQVTKDYDVAGNIVAKMNAAGEIDGVTAVNMLRDYIDTAYNGYYGTNRADLFIGQNAAWDVDELVALLRCVVANPWTLNGTDTIYGIFSREENANSRRPDVHRFALNLFGVRGAESRQDFLYIGTDGNLHDGRMDVETYQAIDRFHDLVLEGLISQSFIESAAVKSENYLEQDLAFCSYDYNQTQTVYNKTKLQNDEGEKYTAIMVPVSRWFDGTDPNGVYMRYTESWRSVKTDGWGISVASVKDDPDKLNACLKLIDYAFSEEGQILMSYGPDAFIKTNDDGSYVTLDFNGKQMPVISDATFDALWELAGGNYTNFARFYLGSTLSFAKSQAFEYNCTHPVGKEGAAKLSRAIALGTIKHPELAITENPWYTSVPTVLPVSNEDSDTLGTYSELNTLFSGDEFIFPMLVVNGFDGTVYEGMTSPEAAAEIVRTKMNGDQYLLIKEKAWQAQKAYYQENFE